MATTSKKLDPLYVIFEQHLLNFQDPEMDRKTLIVKIIAEYLTYLRKNNISVPKALEQPIVEELAAQVNTMLVKKIYGCLDHREYFVGASFKAKRRAKSRYSKLGLSAIREPQAPSRAKAKVSAG